MSTTPAGMTMEQRLRFWSQRRETYTLDETGARKAIRDLERCGEVCGKAADELARRSLTPADARICKDGRDFVMELAMIMGVVDVCADPTDKIPVSELMPAMLKRACEDRDRWHTAALTPAGNGVTDEQLASILREEIAKADGNSAAGIIHNGTMSAMRRVSRATPALRSATHEHPASDVWPKEVSVPSNHVPYAEIVFYREERERDVFLVNVVSEGRKHVTTPPASGAMRNDALEEAVKVAHNNFLFYRGGTHDSDLGAMACAEDIEKEIRALKSTPAPLDIPVVEGAGFNLDNEFCPRHSCKPMKSHLGLYCPECVMNPLPSAAGSGEKK